MKVRGFPTRIKLVATQFPSGIAVRRSDYEAFLQALTDARETGLRRRKPGPAVATTEAVSRPSRRSSQHFGVPVGERFTRANASELGSYPAPRFGRQALPLAMTASDTGMDAAGAGRIGSDKRQIT
ncbi:MAG: hypothetical protein IT435_15925 [Phycisphaerales bacterium]|nr:hypothetical protein [Phycisphaerales bacterium]